MEIKYLCPYWGSEDHQPKSFIDYVKNEEYDGVEINIPKDDVFETNFYNVLNGIRRERPEFICGVQQVFGIKKETPQEYLDKVLKRLSEMVHYQPDFINSHTGKDYYSFSDNCKIIDAIEEFSMKSGIPVYHEIHRGRFTFHSQTTLRYLDVFPRLKFVGDFSHWCVVSECLLYDQEEAIERIIPHIAHLHARVGTEQASQVNNPFAPEWSQHLERFTTIWKDTLDYQKKRGKQLTITPEFGPFPYMPQAPFIQEPLSDQRELNIKMKDYLKSQLL
ncbi:sugar phosphate isomerase/epimerase [Winogradskyella schleiferi]|uniref:sugar phosphate isomerase/epimerase n=1 Tax=Winogradskyella schleiferi TaxID=2686078 RepID=UPI0015C1A333|nr:sugar phosphate isomerase/epimerase [Winogradskyella schleiferi]